MQDRTIDNALTQLCRGGGEQGELARQLLAMRGAPLPQRIMNKPMRKGEASRFVLSCLRERPMTCSEMADRLQGCNEGVGRKSAHNRCHGGLRRLQDRGLVEREGRVWRVTPPAASIPPTSD